MLGPLAHYTISVGETPVIFLSTGISVSSSVKKAGRTGNSKDAPVKKYLSVRPHSQEAEQTIAFIGVLFHLDELYMQIDEDTITYSVKSTQFTNKAKASSSKGPNIAGIQSPVKATQPSAPSAALDVDANISVYDGRKKSFDLDKHVANLTSMLPIYAFTQDGELVPGSFVIVGYTVVLCLPTK
ncbi:hypothetical protein C8J57DRAFT_1513400 [Mycena rebaudengoi]|nr:hypothetical protein C8J57DRAFT_1513400 [Mycena rebaudengoi]